MLRPDAERLGEINEMIKVIRAETDDITFAQYERDIVKRLAVERSLEIISEASRHIGGDIKERNKNVKWRALQDMGNKLRHEYQRVDHTLIWQVIQDQVPSLEKAVKKEIARLSENIATTAKVEKGNDPSP